MNEIDQALKTVTPEIYQNLKHSIATGRWPNGQLLSETQKEQSMQLVIAYESKHVPESQRVGFIKQAGCKA